NTSFSRDWSSDVCSSDLKLNFLIQDKNLDTALKENAQKVLDGIRLTVEEGVLLYERGELGYLGVLANYIREKKHGDFTYFNRNFHIEPTNVCEIGRASCRERVQRAGVYVAAGGS